MERMRSEDQARKAKAAMYDNARGRLAVLFVLTLPALSIGG